MEYQGWEADAKDLSERKVAMAVELKEAPARSKRNILGI